MKKLQDNHFIKRVQNGLWLVNPDILMKGDDHKRQILLSYFESDEPIDQLTVNRTKAEVVVKNQESPFAPVPQLGVSDNETVQN